jgi:EmrB/QacA subfamily drug resistance transporter
MPFPTFRRTPKPVPSAPSPPGPGNQFRALFPSIMLPMFLAMVDQTIVAAALPAIAAELGELERVSWVVISYLVATTISAPVYGRLGDLLGRKRVMMAALAIFLVASFLCAVASSIELLTAARVLQGLGGGGLMTLSQALIGEAVPPRDRGRYQGFLSTVAVSSSAFGAVAGGLLTEYFGWRSIFLVGLPVGAVGLLLLNRLPQGWASGERWRFDVGGLLLFSVFIASTLVLLHQLQSLQPGAQPILLALFALALVTLVALLWWEGHFPDPLLPLSLLRDPTIWRADALAACHGGMLVATVTFTPIYLRVVHGANAGTIGLLLLPIAAGVACGSIVTGFLVSRTGRTAIFPSIGLLVVVPLMVIVALTSTSLSTFQVAGLLTVASLFMGTVMGVVQITVQVAGGPARLGMAAASVQFSRSLGAAIGTAVVGVVLFSGVQAADPEAAHVLAEILDTGPQALGTFTVERQLVIRAELADAFRATYLTIAAFGAIACVLAWRLPMRRI